MNATLQLTISDDPALLDIALIHRFLADESGWARGISVELVAKSIRHSLCFGAYEEGRQIGFARIISDYATYAYLADVFVLPAHRGCGVARALVEAVLAHPELQGLRRMSLVSTEARGLYAKYGWTALATPERYMERRMAAPYAATMEAEARP